MWISNFVLISTQAEFWLMLGEKNEKYYFDYNCKVYKIDLKL